MKCYQILLIVGTIIFLLYLFKKIKNIDCKIVSHSSMNNNDLAYIPNGISAKVRELVNQKELVVTMLQDIIVKDILAGKIMPLENIDGKYGKSLSFFLDKGTIGFYKYSRGVNVPKYYVRKVHQQTRIIIFNDGEREDIYLDVEFVVFLKNIIKAVDK